MQAVQTQFDILAIQSSRAAFDAMVHLRPIHDEAGYDQMTALINSLLDVVGDDEEHALFALLDLVGAIVARYEHEHFAMEPAAPKDSLRFLIEARGPDQEDLSAIVLQRNRSAILAGKRKISATLAGELGKFLAVSPPLFMPI